MPCRRRNMHLETGWKVQITRFTRKRGMKMEEQMYRCGEDIKQIRQWGYHKTFFEEDYRQIPVMDMVLSYMKIVDAEREERFEKALDFVEDQLQKGGFLA